MNARLGSFIRKEFTQTLRDSPIVGLVLYTFAEIVLCGWALTMDIKHIPTAVLDRDKSPASHELLDRFQQADAFMIESYPADEAELDQRLDTGRATLGLNIPPGFGRDVARGKSVAIQAIADGTQTNAALITPGYVNQIVRRYSSEVEVTRQWISLFSPTRHYLSIALSLFLKGVGMSVVRRRLVVAIASE